DVLVGGLEAEGALRDLVLDLGEPLGDALAVGRRDDAAGDEHVAVRERAGDVVWREALVDVDRCGELLDDRRGGGGEPAFPQLVLARRHRRPGYEPDPARFATNAWMRRRSAFRRMNPSASRWS